MRSIDHLPPALLAPGALLMLALVARATGAWT